MKFGPETVITKEVGLSTLKFKPYGSRFSLVLNGAEILTTVVRGGNPNKLGESHPCSPNFDQDTASLGLPNHGTMRNVPVTEILVDTPDTIRTRLLIAGGNYPMGVVVEQNYRLTEGYLEITTSHRNEGNIPAPVNYGDHLYFNAPEGNQGVLMGSNKNRVNLSEAIRSDSILPFEHEKLLDIPGLPRLLLAAFGRRIINPWVDINDQGAFDQNYFCASLAEGDFRPKLLGNRTVPGFFGTPKSMIKPGEVRTSTLFVALAA